MSSIREGVGVSRWQKSGGAELKAAVVPWRCGSWNLGIPYGSVVLRGRATGERQRRKPEHTTVPELGAAGYGKSEHSPAVWGLQPTSELAPTSPTWE